MVKCKSDGHRLNSPVEAYSVTDRDLIFRIASGIESGKTLCSKLNTIGRVEARICLDRITYQWNGEERRYTAVELMDDPELYAVLENALKTAQRGVVATNVQQSLNLQTKGHKKRTARRGNVGTALVTN